MTEVTSHACMHWRRKWQPIPVFLPRETQGWRSLVGCRLWGRTRLKRLGRNSSSRKHLGFPGGSDDKESTCNAGEPGLIPGLGRSPGEGNGNPFQDSCLENSMGRGDWWASVHEFAKSWT